MRILILKSLLYFFVYLFLNLFYGCMEVSINFLDKVYNVFCIMLYVKKNCIEICNFVLFILFVIY